jgi:hypothetical protein
MSEAIPSQPEKAGRGIINATRALSQKLKKAFTPMEP